MVHLHLGLMINCILQVDMLIPMWLPQDKSSLIGKVLRVNRDGPIPSIIHFRILPSILLDTEISLALHSTRMELES